MPTVTKAKTIILVQREENHNKYWRASIDPTNFKVTVQWGRLGTKGQSQVKDFSNQWDADRFVDKKAQEKVNKGYNKIDANALRKLEVEAAIIGTSNKANAIYWVNLSAAGEGYTFEQINESELQNPDCNPGLYVDLTTKKEYDGQSSFRLVFTPQGIAQIRVNKRIDSGDLIRSAHVLHELAERIEGLLGQQFS